MFQVTDVRRALLARRVTLMAIDDMIGTETLISPGRHDLSAGSYAYHFPRGSTLTLRFAPWKTFSRGDRVKLATVLKHPSVQRQLFRAAGS
jgi:hypothetical protein